MTQFSCSYPNLAPQGCSQYFFGSTSGTVQTFNFNSGNGVHLASQDQSICFRRERATCRICYSAALADFDISGNSDTSMAIGRVSNINSWWPLATYSKLYGKSVYISGCNLWELRKNGYADDTRERQ